MIPGELIPIVMFITLGWIIKVLSDNKTKRLLIQKGELNESIRFLYDRPKSQVSSSLKWGMVLVGIGIAIFLGRLISYHEEEVYFALMFVFAGLALLLFYFISGRKQVQAEGNPPEKKDFSQ